MIYIRTNTIRIGTVNDLMLIGLHHFKATNRATLGQAAARGWIIGNDRRHGLHKGLVTAAVQGRFISATGAAM
jgi:hypothetical protein